MDAQLENDYFEWLYGLVGAVRNRNPARSYWTLIKMLHSTEFLWFIPNDDNRLEEGKELRLEFLQTQGIDQVDPEWVDTGCSMLEMLIALSRRMAFEAERSPLVWFWELLENLNVSSYNDNVITNRDIREIEQALDRVINRRYRANGEGGLFPLKSPRQDQRKIELWYQMSAYLLEVAPPV